MSEPAPKRRWFQFSIRELVLLTLATAMGLAWWIEYSRRPAAPTQSELNFGGVKPRIIDYEPD